MASELGITFGMYVTKEWLQNRCRGPGDEYEASPENIPVKNLSTNIVKV